MKPSIHYIFFSLCIFFQTSAYAQNASCPQNLDFEQGNLNNWEFYTGNCCPITTSPSGVVANRHELMSGTATDPYGGFPIVPPGSGSYTLRLGNDQVGAQAERARYYVQVPSNPNAIYTLLYSYAVVFEDPGHSTMDQPRFEVNVYDSATGTPVPCNQFTFVANSTLPGFFQSTTTWRNVLYKPWSTSSIDLSPMAGRTVAIDFSTTDCGLGGHFGYAYLDVACNFFQSYDYYCPSVTSLNLQAPPGFEKYEWWDNNFTTLIGSTKDVTVPTPANSTKYAVILEPFTGFGCPDTLFTQYNIYNMTIDVTEDTAVCRGDSVQLSATTNSTKTPFTYLWTLAPGLGCTNCDNPKASPATFTKYYVNITDNDGCKARDSVNVQVDSIVLADILVGDTFCSHENIDIVNDIASNPVLSQYLWTVDAKEDGNIVGGWNTSDITAQWYSDGVKKIKLLIVNGECTSEDSVELYINPSPRAEFEINNDACVGTNMVLSPYEQDATYKWSIAEHNITDTAFQNLIPLKWDTPGEKRVHLLVSNEYDCTGEKEKYVGIHPYPGASITATNVRGICYGKQYTLKSNEGDRYKYSWYPPQYFMDNGVSEVTGTAEQTGYVYLDVISDWGCKSTDSVFINAESCCDIFMPDAFTPDNNGINDTYWSPDLYKHQLVRFMIANRRGEIVFDTETPGKGWDGTQNGTPLGMDTYHYFVKYLCKETEVVEVKGNFILMR